MSLGTAFKVVGPYLAVGVIAILIASVLVFMARRRIGTWLVRVTSRSDISDAASRLALLVAFSITLLLVALEGVPTLAFAVGIAVHPMEAVLVVAGTVLGTVLAARPLLLRRLAAVVTLVLLATVLVASLAISGWFYDASWDGNATYQVATVELARGWNPLRAPTAAMKLHFDEQLAFEHAPKGVWIRRALIYTSTGRLEQAKADNILLIAAGLSAWLALLLTAAPNRRKTAILGSMLAALNPVSVQQFSTFLFDGQVSSLLVLFVAYAGMAFTSLASWPVFFSVAAVIVMLSTAKFTGLVFAGILAIGLLIGPLGRLRTPKGRSVLASAAIALVIGAFAMGFNPYVTNTLDHASPFYPVMGPNALDIISDLQPPNFAGKGKEYFLIYTGIKWLLFNLLK